MQFKRQRLDVAPTHYHICPVLCIVKQTLGDEWSGRYKTLKTEKKKKQIWSHFWHVIPKR